MASESNTSNDARLQPNTSNPESLIGAIDPTATGFKTTLFTNANVSGQTYIYIAIRRGPMRQPTAGTEVFDAEVQNGDTQITTGWPVDLLISTYTSRSASNLVGDRLRGSGLILDTDNTDADRALANAWQFDSNVSATAFDFSSLYPVINWAFRRAPGFFDVVAYTGAGSARTVDHNLGVVPELVIIKKRNNSGDKEWIVYAAPLGNATRLELQSTSGGAATGMFDSTTPTSTVFSVAGDSAVNGSGDTFIAYLFATLPGVSKVGSYTGNGSSQTINCGFTGGARFVLIKRTDSTGDWYVWDTARGIVSGNDPHLSLNTTAAEVTSDDTIDPDSSGFIVNQVSATNVNVSSASYIFLAVS